MPLAWCDGCEPRVSLSACDPTLRFHATLDKVLTCGTLCFIAALLLHSSRCEASEWRGVRGRTRIAALSCALLGACHALAVGTGFPPPPFDSGVGGWTLELLFSAYNALLVSTLALLNCVWIEELHAAAFPLAAPLREPYARAAKTMADVLLLLPLCVSVAIDVIFASLSSSCAQDSQLLDTAGIDVDWQHSVFAIICTVAGVASIVGGSRLLASSKGCELEGAASAAKARRVHAAAALLGATWMLCPLFCVVCALAGVARRSGGEHALLGQAVIDYSFIVYDMGAIVVCKLAWILLHAYSLLDCVARASHFPPTRAAVDTMSRVQSASSKGERHRLL